MRKFPVWEPVLSTVSERNKWFVSVVAVDLCGGGVVAGSLARRWCLVSSFVWSVCRGLLLEVKPPAAQACHRQLAGGVRRGGGRIHCAPERASGLTLSMR